MPLISVITINYNNCGGLKKTFASVFVQTYKDFEYIVVDGGSKDGSVACIEQNASQIRHWSSEPDRGIYDAMNKGIERAKGDYLLFLNSGDCFAGAEVLGKAAESLGEADIVYGDLVTAKDGKQKKFHRSFEEAGVYNLLMGTIWHPCAFIRRKLFEEYGGYQAEMKLAGDYEFFIRVLLKHGAAAKHISHYIAVFDMGGVSNQPAREAEMLAERELAWKLNFSDRMIDLFKEYVKLFRSREYRIGKLVSRFLPA